MNQLAQARNKGTAYIIEAYKNLYRNTWTRLPISWSNSCTSSENVISNRWLPYWCLLYQCFEKNEMGYCSFVTELQVSSKQTKIIYIDCYLFKQDTSYTLLSKGTSVLVDCIFINICLVFLFSFYQVIFTIMHFVI